MQNLQLANKIISWFLILKESDKIVKATLKIQKWTDKSLEESDKTVKVTLKV